jgi:DNA-binding CsgD family transcriptional regulator
MVKVLADDGQHGWGKRCGAGSGRPPTERFVVVPLPIVATAPLTGRASLTASEQTIVSLVGEGLTNTEIGERLYVYRRTVESHLGRVYVKLGLATRGQRVSADVRQADG